MSTISITKTISISETPDWLNKIISQFGQKGIEIAALVKDNNTAIIKFEKRFSIFGKMEITATPVDDSLWIVGNGPVIGSIQALSISDFVAGLLFLMKTAVTKIDEILDISAGKNSKWDTFTQVVFSITKNVDILPNDNSVSEMKRFYYDLVDGAAPVDTSHYALDALLEYMKFKGVKISAEIDSANLHIKMKQFIEELIENETKKG